ncbi:hypothetical protein [Desulfohalobium retbaense]|uniref:Uncharacterized protein n=1 Tax=Desulfohalobium retbaense (strain ATCC 49708 / DSM 5692 / JCM 16813 / HR100) TaxID=485915 RepID=C8WZT4_DESRD|nr:hypothetical protein [Desulfohalobium retbaense]ACV67559.1 conserved hypothetical protein [Desulfohalobium retbaense DSM 5692]
MQDFRGTYYFPVPNNRQVKMYVRDHDGVIQFRLCNEQEPDVWQRHGWLSYEDVRQASQMYEGELKDPLQFYDFEIAKHLLFGSEDPQKHG